jgi:asparagine synthase (glutamine-hydrolysing)
MAGRGVVPDPSRTRRKKALRIPYAEWLSAEQLPEWAEELLSESVLKRTGFFDPVQVRRIRNELRQGNTRLSTLIMAVLAIQSWSRAFLRV